MTIAIIIALEEEAKILKNELSLISEKKIQKDNIEIWQYKNHKIIINKCGVGKVNAATNTLQVLNDYSIDYLINIGSCGSINKKINLGDLSLITNIFTFDVDLTAFNYLYGQIPNLPPYYSTNYQYLETFAKENQLFFNSIASGDSFINSQKKAKEIKKNLQQNIDLVDMESSGIAQIVFLKKVPLFVLKLVSDNVYLSEQNEKQWKKHINNISFKLSKITLKLVKFIFNKGIKKHD